MTFEYCFVDVRDLEVVHDRGILRIRPLHGKSFGIMRPPPPQRDIFEAFEIQIHTPAEHFKNSIPYDMEV